MSLMSLAITALLSTTIIGLAQIVVEASFFEKNPTKKLVIRLFLRWLITIIANLIVLQILQKKPNPIELLFVDFFINIMMIFPLKTAKVIKQEFF